MMTLEQLRRRVQGAEDLHAIARAMKALAALRIRQSREAVESLDGYGHTVELALRVALRARPGGTTLPNESKDAGGGTGIVVFGSDLGLAGRFNLRIVEFTRQRAAELDGREGPPAVLAVGSRVANLLEADGIPVALRFSAPDSIEAVTATVQDLLVAIEAIRAERDLDRIQLFYNHYHSGATYRPHALHLLPLNAEWTRGLQVQAWPSRVLPDFRVPWATLFSEAVREYLFVSLYGAAARSQASEHASRLASMDAAERRIEELQRDLEGRFNQQRKEQINAELLDLVTGFLAIEGSQADRR